MKTIRTTAIGLLMFICAPTPVVHGQAGEFHEDYYLGFSQGAYYGLMLAGIEYEVAWCVRGELAALGDSIGAGGEFQEKLDAVYAECRAEQ